MTDFLRNSKEALDRLNGWTNSARRLACLMAACLVLGLGLGYFLQAFVPQLGGVVGDQTAAGPVAVLAKGLKVRSATASADGYNRDLFGFEATDDDGDGCEIRQDILIRDLKALTFSPGSTCQVQSGHLSDPYTGKDITFQRGKATSAKVQIDHVVALSDAWKSGAKDWPTQERYRYANDPLNLLAVDGPANQDKGDSSAAYWLPPNQAFDCQYVARQVAIKTKYRLTVTKAEQTAMLNTLHSCPNQALPTPKSVALKSLR